jgi:acyl-CoA-binding protein
MKTEHEREQLIKDINVLLNQAYDSTLDEIYALLKRIDDEDDEEDIKALREAREDRRINGTVSWEEYKGYEKETA